MKLFTNEDLFESLNRIELVAKTQLQKEECLEIISELKEFQSLDEADLEDILRESLLRKEEYLEIISELKEFQSLNKADSKDTLRELPLYVIPDDINYKEIVSNIKSFDFNGSSGSYRKTIGIFQQVIYTFFMYYIYGQGHQIEREELFKKIVSINRTYFAFVMKKIILLLRKTIEFDSLQSREKNNLLLMYHLGNAEGGLSQLEIVMDKDIYDIIHTIMSKIFIQKRWNPVNKTIKKALKLAEEKWENGDPALHNEMADYLFNKYKNECSNLTRNRLLRELRPIARPYGRVRGDKGVKKEI